MKIAVLGGGSFGSAMALALSVKDHDIAIYDRKKELVDEINNERTNRKYLPGIEFPDSERFRATDDLDTVMYADIIILALPSSAIDSISSDIAGKLRPEAHIVSLAKGIDPKTLRPLSEVIEANTGRYPVILSGPSHAEEVSRFIPTALVASSKDETAMVRIQDAFSTGALRVYLNRDLKGVEIGGAVKNIIALAAGISDGIGYGDNTKAALMTRGMSEIIRMGIALGADEKTFSGLTGIGDLIVTCTSMHSRNRRCGILIGQGKSMKEAVEEVGMVVEGIITTESFQQLARRKGIEMPITDAVHSILFEGADPRRTSEELMLRDLKSE